MISKQKETFFAELALFLFLFLIATASASARQVSVIAHTVNTPEMILWALKEGANGIEIDLKFNGVYPEMFHHGAPCDCSCLIGLKHDDNICTEFEDTCTASSSINEMLSFLGSEEIRSSALAIIYVDAKLDKSIRNYAKAGANVVRMLNEQVMSRGYRGQILLGCQKISMTDYLRGALEEAKSSPYADRYFYSIDFENRSAEKVWEASLQLGTKNIVFVVGISSCGSILSPAFYKSIRNSAAKNSYAGVGIWTVDSESLMKKYLSFGVDFILTNRPQTAIDLVGRSNIPLPGMALKARLAYIPEDPTPWDCECSYYRRSFTGGCAITKAAPPNHVCYCWYKGLWACGGRSLQGLSGFGTIPDTSIEACIAGGGNCNGYF